MTVAETCYNPVNVVLWVVLAVCFIVLVLFTQPGDDELVELRSIATQADVAQRITRAVKKLQHRLKR